MSFTASIPEKMRINSNIYNKMLLKNFPSYFINIPCQSQKAVHPISYPYYLSKTLNVSKKIISKVTKYQNKKTNSYGDYTNWIRDQSAKSVFESVLGNPSAIYPNYISQNIVHERLSKHQNKEENHASFLCLTLTFEIWLQQIFHPRKHINKINSLL